MDGVASAGNRCKVDASRSLDLAAIAYEIAAALKLAHKLKDKTKIGYVSQAAARELGRPSTTL